MTDLLKDFQARVQIATLNAYSLLDYQAGRVHYDVFKAFVLVNTTIDDMNAGFLEDWLDNNRQNKLPNGSSGSLFTGLTQFDNLFQYEDYTDEEYEAALAIHTTYMVPLTALAY